MDNRRNVLLGAAMLSVAAIVETEGRLQVETGVDGSFHIIPAGDSRL